jgi:hypothetical protein
MNFDHIKPLFAAVKPFLDTATPVWIKCAHLGWTADSKVTMRPDAWKGVPLPTGPTDDAFEQGWARNPWIAADPCSNSTFVKGTLAYVTHPAPPANQPDLYKTQYPDPQLGHTLHFKPDGMPALTGFIWAHDYDKVTTTPPAGWTDTLSQQYSAALAKAEQQKTAGLW